MKLRVKGDRVLIRPDEQPTTTDSGLHIIYDRQRVSMRGIVLAVGDGPVTAKGVKLPHCVHVGDRVIFSPDSGEELSFEKSTIIAMREEQILAVIQE